MLYPRKTCRKTAKITILPYLVPLLLLLAPRGFAQETFNVYPSSSVVEFSLGDILHSVHGAFKVQSGSIEFNRNVAKIGGTVVVAIGSGSSGNESRDRKMKADILNAPRFPVASFAPNSYRGILAPAGGSTIQVTGVFTLYGTPHEITVPMTIKINGTDCIAKTQFAIPYVKWGLKDPSRFILRVDKAVKIDVTLAGRIS